jgi:1,4-dihydroxy-2-naphthoate octaprenyltransferase
MTTLARPNILISWIQSARPKTLTISLVPFLAGSALAFSEGFSINWLLLLSALGSAFFIQIASHFINDSFDAWRGVDTKERLGPLRVLHNGFASCEQVYDAGMMCFCLSLLFAIPLIIHGGLAILGIILLSMLCAYLYTGGPSPLSVNGLGDLFVIIFYGWVSTFAAYWLQSGSLSGSAFLLGTQIGLLATAIIAINNLRDVQSDAKGGRRTIPVRFGAFVGRVEFTWLIGTAFLLNFIWLALGHPYAAALPWIAFPFALPLIAKIWQTEPSKAYNGYLAQAARLHLLFGLLLCLAFLLN